MNIMGGTNNHRILYQISKEYVDPKYLISDPQISIPDKPALRKSFSKEKTKKCLETFPFLQQPKSDPPFFSDKTEKCLLKPTKIIGHKLKKIVIKKTKGMAKKSLKELSSNLTTTITGLKGTMIGSTLTTIKAVSLSAIVTFTKITALAAIGTTSVGTFGLSVIAGILIIKTAKYARRSLRKMTKNMST